MAAGHAQRALRLPAAFSRLVRTAGSTETRRGRSRGRLVHVRVRPRARRSSDRVAHGAQVSGAQCRATKVPRNGGGARIRTVVAKFSTTPIDISTTCGYHDDGTFRSLAIRFAARLFGFRWSVTSRTKSHTAPRTARGMPTEHPRDTDAASQVGGNRPSEALSACADRSRSHTARASQNATRHAALGAQKNAVNDGESTA
jgi:hypothetical protein